MIFVTVGTQLPFDRLIKAMDAWCVATSRRDVYGQIADPGPNGYYPAHFQWERFLSPRRFERYIGEADLIVAHAGMGSIISALTMAKPIVIMPRREALGEHRNDHQHATWQRFKTRSNIFAAHDENTLPGTIERALQGAAPASPAIGAYAHDSLIAAIHEFIRGGDISSPPVSEQHHERRSPRSGTPDVHAKHFK